MKCQLTIGILLCLVSSCLFLNGCKKEQQDVSGKPEAKPEGDAEKKAGIPEPVRQPGEFTELVEPVRERRVIPVRCVRIDEKPVINGKADDDVWSQPWLVHTLDFSSQREILLKTFHDGERIYFLVRYPDEAPSETHKTWAWDHEEKVYKPLFDREDAFVFKWLLTGDHLGFTPELAMPHTADLWFWKACRTNPGGYFDDKIQIASAEEVEDTVKLESSDHGTLYLKRKGDSGKSAYEEKTPFEYQGDFVPKYHPRTPGGSRADIQGKGVWEDGYWTIEMSRKLQTGNDDDVQFVSGGEYPFGVSLYEMAATGVDPKYYQPLYRSGDVFDALLLVIE